MNRFAKYTLGFSIVAASFAATAPALAQLYVAGTSYAQGSYAAQPVYYGTSSGSYYGGYPTYSWSPLTAHPSSGRAPLTVQFYASTNNASEIEYGDGFRTAVTCGSYAYYGCSIPAHTYAAAGTYTARLYYQPSFYCPPGYYCAQVMPARQLVGSATVTVSGGGHVSVSGIDAPTNLSVGQTGTWTVSVTSPSPYLSYSVVWGDEQYMGYAAASSAQASYGSSGTFTHTYRQAGTYRPTFTVRDPYTGQTASASATVTVSGAAGGCMIEPWLCGSAGLVASPASGSAPLTVTFTANTASGCNGGNFTLRYGDGTSDFIPIPADGCRPTITKAHTYQTAGTYTATLLGTMGNAERILGSATVTVSAAGGGGSYCSYYPWACWGWH